MRLKDTMILSQACKYGLRALLYLAQQEETPCLSRDIARQLQIPEHFLAKVLQDLSRNGLLHSFKGRGGGFKLAHPPDQLTLLEIVRAIDGPRFGQGCLLGLPNCGEDNPCPLHSQWAEHKARLLDMLQKNTLGQVVARTAGERA
jgi:Rrf2 family protein